MQGKSWCHDEHVREYFKFDLTITTHNKSSVMIKEFDILWVDRLVFNTNLNWENMVILLTLNKKFDQIWVKYKGGGFQEGNCGTNKAAKV